MIRSNQYVPVIKWRQGEYQALMRLHDGVKDNVVPLIMIPPIEFDFEDSRPKKNIDEHLEKFGERVSQKWNDRLLLFDMHNSLDEEVLHNGELPIEYIMKSLDKYSCNYIPVLSFKKNNQYIDSIKKNIGNTRGVAIRISLAELGHPDFNSWLNQLTLKLNVNINDIDLIVDLARPDTFVPYIGFGRLVSHYINHIHRLEDFRSLVVISTSLNLSEVKKPGGEFDRHEWIFFKELISNHFDGVVKPVFGDYTIETPEFLDVDFRKMRPAGKIIYTCDDIWLIQKGGAFRRDRAQMVEHCRRIQSSLHFSGNQFSWGDAKIVETAANTTTNYGQLTTWKQVGVNHHITKVVSQLASFFSS